LHYTEFGRGFKGVACEGQIQFACNGANVGD
jgi:hypothetical protein